MNLPPAGSYTAQQNGTVLIRSEESGALMAYIPYALIGVAYSGIYALCLGAKDGTASVKNITTLKTVFPEWDKDELADIEMPSEGEAPQFELADCYHDDSYTPPGAESPVVQFKAKWLNPVGGGMKKQPMTEAERKTAKTKWASKFKAALASQPAKLAAASKPAASPTKPETKPAAKAAVGGPPGRKAAKAARTSSLEEAWAKLEESTPDLSEEDRAQKWYDACDSVVDGSSSDADLIDTPEKWGQVADALGV